MFANCFSNFLFLIRQGETAVGSIEIIEKEFKLIQKGHLVITNYMCKHGFFFYVKKKKTIFYKLLKLNFYNFSSM